MIPRQRWVCDIQYFYTRPSMTPLPAHPLALGNACEALINMAPVPRLCPPPVRAHSIRAGQFDPALQVFATPFQTPPQDSHSSLSVQPLIDVCGSTVASLQHRLNHEVLAPGCSETTAEAAVWVTNVAAAWNLRPQAESKTGALPRARQLASAAQLSTPPVPKKT